MIKGNVKVEQIQLDNDIVLDFGEIFSSRELKEKIKKCFNMADVYGIYKGKKFSIFAKNVSYLGNPHPLFKKRIQIPPKFKDTYENNMKQGIVTLLIGVYCYDGNLLFCDFDISNYIENRLNNSSAHIYTSDLLKGNKLGTFQKIDSKNNIITVFNTESVHKFLDYKLFGEDSVRTGVVRKLDEFFSTLPAKWYGIDCYKEMNEANFANKNQSEWAGWYLEYQLEKFIKSKEIEDVITYSQNKKANETDLDLYFPELNCYGDLKAHSISSTGIQGNDKETILKEIEKGSIYYVVCNHETLKDKDSDYEVTKFWNEQLRKKDLYSYGDKMKNTVFPTEYIILEINKSNLMYLKDFHQGKNSNGKERKIKISISKKNIDCFLIHKKDLTKKH